jgi:hypothetical protein
MSRACFDRVFPEERTGIDLHVTMSLVVEKSAAHVEVGTTSYDPRTDSISERQCRLRPEPDAQGYDAQRHAAQREASIPPPSRSPSAGSLPQ